MRRLGWRLVGLVLGVVVTLALMRACGMQSALPISRSTDPPPILPVLAIAAD